MSSRKSPSKSDSESGSKWMWILGSLFLLFLVASIVIVIVAVSNSGASLPKHIDLVLHDRGNGLLASQLKAVQKYMTFCHKIFVLSPTKTGDIEGVTYIPFTSTNVGEGFLAMATIADVADHAMYLGDSVYPFRKIRKTYLFFGDRPRMFNAFRDASEQVFFESAGYSYAEKLPTFVVDIKILKEVNAAGGTTQAKLNSLYFRSITEDRVVIRNDINREVFINDGAADNVTKQFTKLDDYPPLFGTFLTLNSPSLTLLVSKLNTFFKVV